MVHGTMITKAWVPVRFLTLESFSAKRWEAHIQKAIFMASKIYTQFDSPMPRYTNN